MRSSYTACRGDQGKCLRQLDIDAQKGRKLEAKWLGPRLLVSKTKHGMSGYVREIYREGKLKRYHLNDMLWGEMAVLTGVYMGFCNGQIAMVAAGIAGGSRDRRLAFSGKKSFLSGLFGICHFTVDPLTIHFLAFLRGGLVATLPLHFLLFRS